MPGWRVEDEVLLQRLEDESVLEALFVSLVSPGTAERTPRTSERQGASSGRGEHDHDERQSGERLLAGQLHPRAAGLVAELRKHALGAAVVSMVLREGDVAHLASFIDDLVLAECAPELLHHLALFHAKVASALEQKASEAAAAAWCRSLAAWLALADERSYLTRLEEAVLGEAARPGRRVDLGPSPERMPLEVVAEIAGRADATARDLGAAGRAALLALARTDDAARMAGAPEAVARRVRAEAERRRNAAIEAALVVIGDGLDEANVRGELASSGRTLLLRAIPVWSWTSHDEAVEHFVVDRIDKIGWELYRARSWEALRYLLDPFRPMFDSLAARIERDPSQIAYAAACAQMFVFLSEVDPHVPRRLALAERAVKICPTHRNGRLVLASALCDEAIHAMRAMVIFARKDELERVQGLLERAESLYPQTSELAEAKGMFERVKKGRIAV